MELDAARVLYRDRSKAVEARAAFEKLAALDPQHPDVNFHLGQLANHRDEPEKAVKYFEAALAVEPNAGRHHHGLGDALGRSAQKAGIFSKLGLAKKCLAAYERAVALDPGVVEFRLSLFEFYRQAPAMFGGGFEKASAQVAAIRKLDPARGWAAFSTLYAGEKKFTEAFAEFEAHLKTSPDDYIALQQLGRFSATTGHSLDRGLVALRRCLELPVPPGAAGHAAIQWRIGNIHVAKNDPASARAAYEAALKLDPNFTQAADALKKLQ